MTKKIKSIKHLHAEKKRMQQRLAEVEKAIQYDWRDVKESLKPKNIAGQVFSGILKKETANGESTVGSTIAEVVAGFTRVLVEKMELKLNEWLKPK